LNKLEGELVVCVVYDAKSGNIVHIHSIMALPGAKIASAYELEQEALQLAKSREANSKADLRVLHVSKEDHHKLRAAMKVDPNTHTLLQPVVSST